MIPSGTEPIATGIVGALLIVWSKIRFVGKVDFIAYKKETGEVHKEIFRELKVITKHMGAVEKYMEMKK